MLPMIRTQVQLKERQLHRLRALAAERGLSISELVRNGVENVLAQMGQGAHTTRAQRAISAAGRFHSGRSDSPAATTTFWSLPMKHPRGDRVFVDTSALHAVLDADDEVHAHARTAWRELIQAGALLVTSSYVCVETTSLVQARLGMDAVRALYNDLLPVVTVVVIDDAHHTNAVATLLGVNRRDLSLVDCSSFAMMRQRGISTAFAFDRHFAQQGFRLISYPPDR